VLGIVGIMFGVPIGILALKDRAIPRRQQPVRLMTRSTQPTGVLKCSGAFIAQFEGDFFSSDLGTIFQFFVFPDRLVMIEVGGLLNQLPSFLLSHGGSRRAVGLKDYSAHGLPSLEQAQAIVTKVNAKKVLGLKTSMVPSRETMAMDILRIENTKTFKHPNALRIHFIDSDKLLFHFAKPEEASRAGALLRPVFADKYSEQPGVVSSLI
jgi:hypothetical protein